MRNGWVAAVVLVVSGCGAKPTCPDGDHECLLSSLKMGVLSKGDRGPALPLTNVDGARLVTPRNFDAAITLVFASPTLEIDPGGEVLGTAFQDSQGCQPAYCMQSCPRGVRCTARARCTPAVRDGLTKGTSVHWVEFGSAPVSQTDFDLVVTPVAAAGCPIDVASQLQADSAEPHVGVGQVLQITALGKKGGGSGGGSGGGGTGGGTGGGGSPSCLTASTRLCTPIGNGGVGSTCISRAEYETATGLPLPSSPAPNGTTGCYDSQKGALVKPCEVNSTCRVGSGCSGGSVVGGD